MFTVGEHRKSALHGSDRAHIGRVDRTGEGVFHQLHTDPIQVLNNQKFIR